MSVLMDAPVVTGTRGSLSLTPAASVNLGIGRQESVAENESSSLEQHWFPCPPASSPGPGRSPFQIEIVACGDVSFRGTGASALSARQRQSGYGMKHVPYSEPLLCTRLSALPSVARGILTLPILLRRKLGLRV